MPTLFRGPRARHPPYGEGQFAAGGVLNLFAYRNSVIERSACRHAKHSVDRRRPLITWRLNMRENRYSRSVLMLPAPSIYVRIVDEQIHFFIAGNPLYQRGAIVRYWPVSALLF